MASISVVVPDELLVDCAKACRGQVNEIVGEKDADTIARWLKVHLCDLLCRTKGRVAGETAEMVEAESIKTSFGA